MTNQQLTYSPFDPDGDRGPYPVYRELRDHAPAYWSPAGKLLGAQPLRRRLRRPRRPGDVLLGVRASSPPHPGWT